MKTKYLLPCSCGNQIPVDAGQAGLLVPCTCGAELTVPTMRGLSTLERAAFTESRAGSGHVEWGYPQAMIFLGVALALLAGVPAAYIWFNYPREQELNQIYELLRDEARAHLEKLTIEETFREWEEMNKPLMLPLEVPFMQQYLDREKLYRLSALVVAAVMSGALLLAGAGLVAKKKGGRCAR